MKIAFVVSDISSPPKEGLHEQSLLLIDELLKRGHDVHLFGFYREKYLSTEDLRRRIDVAAVRLTRTCLPWIARAIFAPALQFWQPIREQINEIIDGDFDVIHLEGIGSLPLLSTGGRGSLTESTVLNLIDPGSLRFTRLAEGEPSLIGRLKYFVGALLHGLMEARMVSKSIPLVVVSELDLAYLSDNHPNLVGSCIPILVPSLLSSIESRHRTPSLRASRVVISCDLRQEHMRRALFELLESAKGRVEDHELELLGRVSAAQIDVSAYSSLGMRVITWVPDYMDYLSSSSLVILPDTVGTGIKNRAVQAMAVGVAVMATDVAMEGIPATPGLDYYPLDGNEDWVSRVNNLLRSPDHITSVAQRGQKLVHEHFANSSAVDKWVSMYVELQSG